MRIVAISDTHKKHSNLDIPDGDVLVHAGDMTPKGATGDLSGFSRWLNDIEGFDYKVVIAGNHDFCFEDERRNYAIEILKEGLASNIFYLEDDGMTIDGKYFYGTPWTPEFHDWAFNLDKKGLKKRFDRIPDKTDVLISHGPPYKIQDGVMHSGRNEDPHVGSSALRRRVFDIKPDAHIFGHIHEAYGRTEEHGIKFVNASICTLRLNPDNDPVIIDID